MANPARATPGQPHLLRDNQQWVFDYVLQESGRTYHWWTGEGRTLPESVRSHAMVSKHLGRSGLAKEADARAKKAEAEARAEEAAASLLAELSIDSSGGVSSKKKGKQKKGKGKKKGRK